MEVNKIYNEDCIKGMKERIPDNSIDLIVTDPPYNIGKDDWDKIDNYIDWCSKWIKQCERVLKNNGSFYFFHNDFEVLAELQNWIRENTDFVFRQLITWNKIDKNFKNYGFVQQRLSINSMREYYGGFTEYCLFYTFDDKTGLQEIHSESELFQPIKKYLRKQKQKSGLSNKDFNLMFSKYTNKDGCVDRSVIEHYWQNSQWVFPTKEIYENVLQKTGYFQKTYAELEDTYEKLRKKYQEKVNEYENNRYKFNVAKTKQNLRANSNVWLYPPAEQIGHITPKPLPMIKNIIKHSSDEDDIILDCFGGSGTTAKACQNLNRQYILFETNEDYVKLTKDRLRQENLFSQAK